MREFLIDVFVTEETFGFVEDSFFKFVSEPASYWFQLVTAVWMKHSFPRLFDYYHESLT